MIELKAKFLGCPLCSAESEVLLQADCRNYVSWHEMLPPVLSWMRCTGCGHVHTEDYWTQAGLEQVFAYTHANQAAGGNPDQKRQTWKPVVQNVLTVLGGYSALQALSPPPTWLEVGCGDGALVMTAAEFGFNAIGLDARGQTVQALRASGYQAVCGDFMTIKVEGNPFIISMMDVLEHLQNPCEALQRAHSLLHPKGVLVISLPNSDCSSWRLMGNANPYWIEIEHYHNFSRQRLTALLNQYGFDVVHYDIPSRYKAQMELYAVKKTSDVITLII
ncbi:MULTISPECIES: class I SAM-dependent methyltransferase [Methylobacter]